MTLDHARQPESLSTSWPPQNANPLTSFRRPPFPCLARLRLLVLPSTTADYVVAVCHSSHASHALSRRVETVPIFQRAFLAFIAFILALGRALQLSLDRTRSTSSPSRSCDARHTVRAPSLQHLAPESAHRSDPSASPPFKMAEMSRPLTQSETLESMDLDRTGSADPMACRALVQ